MDQQNMIATLRDIRSALLDSTRSVNRLDQKMLGPRPSNPESGNKAVSESVVSLLSEIYQLSVGLHKSIESQHSVLGEFGEVATPARFG